MKSLAGKVAKYIILLCAISFCSTLPALSWAAIGEESTLVRDLVLKSKLFTGDFDEMKKRRLVRVLVPYSKTFFFFDGAQPKGLSYEAVAGFGKFLNKKFKTKNLEIQVIVVPTPRDQLFARLKDGRGDIAVGNLTITDERLKLVDFSEPFFTGVSEILVTSKNTEPLKSSLELSGSTVHTRKSSSYYQSLNNLNQVFVATGKAPINIVLADEHLEDEDLLEMVNADLMPAVIIDKHKADFWAQILPDIRLHPEVEVSTMGKIGWAVRKNSPQLLAEINQYRKQTKKGTLTGNVVFNRYLKKTDYIKNSAQGENIQRFNAVVDYFKKYGKQYDFDYLMLTALGYQESRLNQELKSKVGAVGVMQILPSTAKDKNVGISNIHEVESNIHAGTKYLRFVADSYFPKEDGLDELNRALFCFASYNAGPSKIARMRAEAKKNGLNPNVWFNSVELVVARKIGRETVQYVSNIFKYYIAYKLIQEQDQKTKSQS